MLIDNKMIAEGSADYYNPSFRNVIEAHLLRLRSSSSLSAQPVSEHQTIIYEQDFFGFLSSIGVPMEMHWVIMRLNNFFSPYQFDRKCTAILLLPQTEIDKLRQSWATEPLVTG